MGIENLQKIEGVVALPPSVADVVTADQVVELEGTSKYQDAGWRFVDQLEIPGARAVYRQQRGTIIIEGSTVVVRFHDDTADDVVSTTLAERQLQVTRRLRFMPIGFQVRSMQPEGPGHTLRIALALGQLESVRYAEPDFIENIEQI